MIKKNKTAFIFPGQGSQFVGMGKDLCEKYEIARDIFEKANKILGRNISKICFEGPEETLKATENTQSAIVSMSLCVYEVLKQKTNILPDFVAGHSLGEYCALYASNVLSFEDTLKLIEKRSFLMGQAASLTKGKMAAILGLESEKIVEILQLVKSGYVAVANYNTKEQTVITGENSAIDEACELLKSNGAKRAIVLNVSGAFHSKLMEQASIEFEKYIENVSFNNPKISIVTNVDGEIETSAEKIKEKMPKQISNSVYWVQSVEKMISQGVDTFVEVGPGKVLSAMIKKINSDVRIYNASDVSSLENVVKELEMIGV